MTMVKAAIEHRIKGQMGQPAAWMIDSKRSSEADGWRTTRGIMGPRIKPPAAMRDRARE